MNNNQLRQENQPEEAKFFKQFDDMNLNVDVLRGIYAYGFTSPSIIQQRTIVPLSQGQDIIAQAQSGTGKTAAFAIGSLQLLDSKSSKIQVIIIEPTADLSLQTAEVIRNLGEFKKIRVLECIGGSPTYKDVSKLKKIKPHYVVGTPGRVLQLIQKKKLETKFIKLIVLDEADEVLSEGFADQIREITLSLNKETQVALFSATLKPETLGIAELITEQANQMLLRPEDVCLEGITQSYVDVNHVKWKVATLYDLIESLQISQGVVFCNSRKSTEMVANYLQQEGINAVEFHSGIPGEERKKFLDDFRIGKIRLLLSTDVLARGIDVSSVSTVINFEMPSSVQTYLHRIGRCGRFGRKGRAVSIVTSRDDKKLSDLQEHHIRITPLEC